MNRHYYFGAFLAEALDCLARGNYQLAASYMRRGEGINPDPLSLQPARLNEYSADAISYVDLEESKENMLGDGI